LAAHGTSCLELVAVSFGIAGVWLSVYEKTLNWPIGIINVALYAVLFVQQRLYANAGLQVFYVGVSIYGWYQWVHAADRSLVITHAPRAKVVPLIVATLAIWIALVVATRLAGGNMPLVDSGTTAVSLVAEWMLAKKLVENWAVWIAVDAVYVAMLLADKLYLTTINYAIYFVLAVVGYREWRRLARIPA
jgi:nicotinamide mononucleotide transporter